MDGHEVGSVRDQLNNDGQWTLLSEATIARGSHSIALRYGGSRLSPGTGGLPLGMGPLLLGTTTADLPVTFVSPGEARSLCVKRLDWLEALAR